VIFRLSAEQRTAGLRKPIRGDGNRKSNTTVDARRNRSPAQSAMLPKKPLEPSRTTA
jgi:hypothetical protein